MRVFYLFAMIKVYYNYVGNVNLWSRDLDIVHIYVQGQIVFFVKV